MSKNTSPVFRSTDNEKDAVKTASFVLCKNGADRKRLAEYKANQRASDDELERQRHDEVKGNVVQPLHKDARPHTGVEAALTAPYSDMIITMVTTMQEEMVMALRRTLLSGRSRKLNATPFASLETKNQSQQKAKM